MYAWVVYREELARAEAADDNTDHQDLEAPRL
jgi:hypothetical protein